MNAAHNKGRSVYGLLVHGLDDVGELLPPQGQSSQTEIRVDQCDLAPPPLRDLTTSQVVRKLADGRYLAMTQQTGQATFYGPGLEPDLLAHPYLGPVAVTFNRWAGREAYHAGAFVAGGKAWIVVGERTAGKSTLMAALAGRGVPVLSDDIVITDGTYVFAGPRSIDLREPIPDLGLAVRQSRLGTRHRISLPPVENRVEVGGWIFLLWGETTQVHPVTPRELLTRVAGRRSLPSLPTDPACVLGLAAIPAWDHIRPRKYASLPESVDLLLGVTAQKALVYQ